jgi:hypothetical protein
MLYIVHMTYPSIMGQHLSVGETLKCLEKSSQFPSLLGISPQIWKYEREETYCELKW